MVAAEAAAAACPSSLTDRCGVRGFFADGEALVVPYERSAVAERSAGPRRPSCGPAFAPEGWRPPPHVLGVVCDRRKRSTGAVASRTASTKISTGPVAPGLLELARWLIRRRDADRGSVG